MTAANRRPTAVRVSARRGRSANGLRMLRRGLALMPGDAHFALSAAGIGLFNRGYVGAAEVRGGGRGGGARCGSAARARVSLPAISRRLAAERLRWGAIAPQTPLPPPPAPSR